MPSLTDVYVAVKPDVDRFEPELKKKLAKIDASEAGKRAGGSFGIGFSRSLPAIGGRVSALFKSSAGMAAAAVGGAAVAGAFGASFTSALSVEDAQAKLAGQLGLTGAQAARVGKVAGDLFKNAYGESLTEVNEALRRVVQDTGTSINSVDLQPLTGQVISVAKTFDQDLGGVTRSVGQLMKTGLAANATEALDIVTRGFQSGADKSEDFLDTLNEYGTQFRKFGISGQQATGLISQGIKAGARDSDIVADAIKEFSIRAVDGSKATVEGFRGIGLSAGEMAARIGKGGASANTALDLTLDRLRKVEDPVKRSRLAVQLFGTQAEDLGDALFALDPSSAVAALGKVGGAAASLDQSVGATASAALTKFQRTVQSALVTGMGAAIQAFQDGKVTADGFLGGVQRVGAFAGKVFDTVSLGVKAFSASLREGDVTSDGFVGVMERIGAFLKVEVIPRVQELAAVWLPRFRAALAAVGGFVAGTLVPAIGDLVGWLVRNRDIVIPLVAAVVAGVAAYKTYLAVVKLITAATKIWAGVQVALNVVMNLNPIGVVIAAIAALTVGIVVAYKRSETFRNIVNGLWTVIKTGSQAAASAILGMVSRMLGAMSSLLGAMGKLPGPLGAPFRKAAEAIDRAQGRVKALQGTINSLKGRSVAVNVDMKAFDRTYGQNYRLPGEVVQRRAFGGRIQGYSPGDRSDNIAARLTAGEFVVQRPRVRELDARFPGFLERLNAGQIDLGGDPGNTIVAVGHKVRGQQAAGSLPRFADGGRVREAQSFAAQQIGEPYVWGGTGPQGWDCSGFAGGAYAILTGKNPNRRYFTTDSIGAAQGFRPGKGVFTVGVTPGRGHMAFNIGGQAFEATPPRLRSGNSAAPVTSFARQFYLPEYGGQFMGQPGLTKAQMAAVVRANGPRIMTGVARDMGFRKMDRGGQIEPGWNPPIYNGTGRPEPVTTARSMDQAIAELRALRKELAAIPVARVDGRVIKREYDNQSVRNPSGW